jgi:hypothetical protein
MRLTFRLISWIVAALVSISTCPAKSAAADSTASIQCTSSLTSWHKGDDLSLSCSQWLREWSASRGILIETRAEWAVWIEAVPVDEPNNDQFILCVGIGHTLPDDAMEAGKKAEVLYSSLPSERRATLPGEGEWVREMMTGEFLSQFVMPIDQNAIVVHRSELPGRAETMLDAIIRNRVKWQKI